jgi:membrane peptidoglycan carboxypeptidase
MLPAPRKRNPHQASKALRKRARQILHLYWQTNELTADELIEARWRLDGILGLP